MILEFIASMTEKITLLLNDMNYGAKTMHQEQPRIDICVQYIAGQWASLSNSRLIISDEFMSDSAD